jgi:hypothetical protein
MQPLKVIALSGLLLVSLRSSAHHSFAGTFDVGHINELEGEITRVQWQNPHVRLTLQDADGEFWAIETHSVSILRRMNIGSEVLSVGDHVKVAGFPARRPVNEMFVLNALLPSGDEVVFEPGAQARWANQTVGTSATWLASQGDASNANAGIFRVWSTSLPGGMLFREQVDPEFSLNSYPLTAAARAALAAFDALTDTPTLNCAPKGMPTIMEQPYPMEFVDQGERIVLRLEEYDTVRTIHLSQEAPATGEGPSRLGYSVGHWEGDTLVVETTRADWRYFNTEGIPLLGADVELVEQFTPTADGSRLNYKLTVSDPETFTEPVVLQKYWLSLPEIRVQPYECTN